MGKDFASGGMWRYAPEANQAGKRMRGEIEAKKGARSVAAAPDRLTERV
jgi:hypothetical protein